MVRVSASDESDLVSLVLAAVEAVVASVDAVDVPSVVVVSVLDELSIGGGPGGTDPVVDVVLSVVPVAFVVPVVVVPEELIICTMKAASAALICDELAVTSTVGAAVDVDGVLVPPPDEVDDEKLMSSLVDELFIN